MSKMATVAARVDERTKKEAERIFRELGIPMSSAIYAFLKAVVRNKGIPFELKIEGVAPPYPYEGVVAKTREAELSETSLKALREVEEGKVKPYFD